MAQYVVLKSNKGHASLLQLGWHNDVADTGDGAAFHLVSHTRTFGTTCPRLTQRICVQERHEPEAPATMKYKSTQRLSCEGGVASSSKEQDQIGGQADASQNLGLSQQNEQQPPPAAAGDFVQHKLACSHDDATLHR